MDALNVSDTLALSTGSATGNPRNKVALKRGRGIMDWVRLGHTEPDLAGTGGKLLKVTLSELAKHNTKKDAWMALKGNVYNVTPYFEYHPGGEDELLRGAGIDATSLFNEVHKWVNFSSMLQKCLVGTLVEETSFFSKPNFLPFRKGPKTESKSYNNLMLPSLPGVGINISSFNLGCDKNYPLAPKKTQPPKYDWFQTKEVINVSIYTKWKSISLSHVFVIAEEESMKIVTYVDDHVLTLHWELYKPIARNELIVKLIGDYGKIDILLKKVDSGIRWQSIGKTLNDHNQWNLRRDAEIEYVSCIITEKVQLNHNSYLMVLETPSSVYMRVPIGFHVYLKITGSEMAKPYTPVVTPFIVSKTDEEDVSDPRKIVIFFKVYDDGELTPRLEDLCEGDTLDVSLPEGSFSDVELERATVNSSHLVLLGAGTGITPLIKLMLEALKNHIKVILITFNKTEADIPWKVELDSLVNVQHRLKVMHVLSQPSDSWQGLVGRIGKRMIEGNLPTTDNEKPSYVAVCGSKGFNENAARILNELHIDEQQMFVFDG